MTNDSSIKYILINNKNELKSYWSEIKRLFASIFNKELNYQLWEWAYINNPFDDPLVVLAYYEKELVGHYALIPQLYVQGSTSKYYKAYLSMTSMVERRVVKYNIFQKMAELANLRAIQNSYSFTVGFPNKNAVNGLAKRIGWTIDVIDSVYLLSKQDILMYLSANKDFFNKDKISININHVYKKWRLSKPEQLYEGDYSIYKLFKDNIMDIVFLNENINFLEDEKKYNILLPSGISEFEEKVCFDYQFAYKIYDETILDIVFKKDLIMSDIF